MPSVKYLLCTIYINRNIQTISFKLQTYYHCYQEIKNRLEILSKFEWNLLESVEKWRKLLFLRIASDKFFCYQMVHEMSLTLNNDSFCRTCILSSACSLFQLQLGCVDALKMWVLMVFRREIDDVNTLSWFSILCLKFAAKIFFIFTSRFYHGWHQIGKCPYFSSDIKKNI